MSFAARGSRGGGGGGVVHYASLEDQFKGPVHRGKRELEKSACPTKKNTNFMWGIKFDKMTLKFIV